MLRGTKSACFEESAELYSREIKRVSKHLLVPKANESGREGGLQGGKEQDESRAHLIERDEEREVLVLQIRPSGREGDLGGQVHRVGRKNRRSFLRIVVVLCEESSIGFGEVLDVECFRPVAGHDQWKFVPNGEGKGDSH